jgi:para-aminobenzoate synthetase component 1
MKGLSWHWRSLPLNERSGAEIFERLFLTQPIATLLESPYPTPQDSPYLSRYSLCTGSPRRINQQYQYWTPPIGQILPFLKDLLAQNTLDLPESTPDIPTHLPFTGGWLGWLGYDLAWEIESLSTLNPDPLPFPVAYWYEPDSFAVLDHVEQKLWLACSDPPDLDRLEAKLAIASEPKRSQPNFTPTFSPVFEPDSSLTFCTRQREYEATVTRAKAYIQSGDIFQANLSFRFHLTTNWDSWSVYRSLQQINPSPFASYWQTPWGKLVSCSPERLIHLQGRTAQTRPIAGTRPRGSDSAQEKDFLAELICDRKELAEHIMLVDLARNDLGRVCEWGSVRVDELLAVERYSHVMHLVSNVIGTLKPKYDAVDLIRAVFPGGTITGCPKVRCLEIIEELEPLRRNLFYGSCGYLDRRGNLDLNILIRSLLMVPESAYQHRVWGQVGAGIVADSDPTKEWNESLQKAQAQLLALTL